MAADVERESIWLERLRGRVQRVGTAPRVSAGDLALIEQALSECPGSVRLWNLRGDLIQLNDDGDQPHSLDDVVTSYERAIELAPDDPEAYTSLGYFLDAVQDKVADAEPMFRRAVELGGRTSAWAGLARVLAQLGRRAEALQLLDPASCPYGSEPEVIGVRDEIERGRWSQD